MGGTHASASDPTPRGRGFRWPAEWWPHEATLLAWPHDPETFPRGLERVEDAFAAFAAVISRGETVHMLVGDKAMAERAIPKLEAAGAEDVLLHIEPTADVWFRDYGPITLIKPKGKKHTVRLSVDFTFNAWGGKYEALLADDTIPVRLQDTLGIELLSTDFVLEGGSIDGDGEGTILTTEQCLLNPNRNPDLSREEIEEMLGMFLGAEKVLWLGEGVLGDDTDGHIDDITRFVAPGKVVTAVQPDRNDPDHAPLAANLERLRTMTDAKGRALEVRELPMPDPVLDPDGARLPASHANFYIANHAVCVPIFGSSTDDKALAVLGDCFPEREVVGIRCEDVVQGLGSLHCVSQQVPL